MNTEESNAFSCKCRLGWSICRKLYIMPYEMNVNRRQTNTKTRKLLSKYYRVRKLTAHECDVTK